MRKILTLGICLLFIVLLSMSESVEAVNVSGKTHADITFIQGDQLKEKDKNIANKIKELLPYTGEEQTIYLSVIGIVIFILVFLRYRIKNKKI